MGIHANAVELAGKTGKTVQECKRAIREKDLEIAALSKKKGKSYVDAARELCFPAPRAARPAPKPKAAPKPPPPPPKPRRKVIEDTTEDKIKTKIKDEGTQHGRFSTKEKDKSS